MGLVHGTRRLRTNGHTGVSYPKDQLVSATPIWTDGGMLRHSMNSFLGFSVRVSMEKCSRFRFFSTPLLRSFSIFSQKRAHLKSVRNIMTSGTICIKPCLIHG